MHDLGHIAREMKHLGVSESGELYAYFTDLSTDDTIMKNKCGILYPDIYF